MPPSFGTGMAARRFCSKLKTVRRVTTIAWAQTTSPGSIRKASSLRALGSAQILGPWTLLGFSVAPSFDFVGFELAPKDFVP